MWKNTRRTRLIRPGQSQLAQSQVVRKSKEWGDFESLDNLGSTPVSRRVLLAKRIAAYLCESIALLSLDDFECSLVWRRNKEARSLTFFHSPDIARFHRSYSYLDSEGEIMRTNLAGRYNGAE